MNKIKPVACPSCNDKHDLECELEAGTGMFRMRCSGCGLVGADAINELMAIALWNALVREIDERRSAVSPSNFVAPTFDEIKKYSK